MLWRTVGRGISDISFPSMMICPETTSLRRRRESAKLLLPLMISSSQSFASYTGTFVIIEFLPSGSAANSKFCSCLHPKRKTADHWFGFFGDAV